MNDFVSHLTRQAAFSHATFGPGPHTNGVSDHVRKELEEIASVYADPGRDQDCKLTERKTHAAAALEWTDVAILGLDGLLRAISSANPDMTFDAVAHQAFLQIRDKQGKNERRTWPDWRKAKPDTAIEHDRTDEEVEAKAREAHVERPTLMCLRCGCEWITEVPHPRSVGDRG